VRLGRLPGGLGRFPVRLGRFPVGLGRFPVRLGRFPVRLGRFPVGLGRLPGGLELGALVVETSCRGESRLGDRKRVTAMSSRDVRKRPRRLTRGCASLWQPHSLSERCRAAAR
jgi:hypothetical protein